MGAEISKRTIVWIVIAMAASLSAYGQGVAGAPSDKASVLPQDIDPESFSRLPLLKRADLDEDGKRVYDMIAGGADKKVAATGPVPISLYSPKVAEAMQILNQYLRYHGTLNHRDSEVAILLTAREFDQHYEWSGHILAARAAMVPESTIDVIKYNKDVTGLSEKDTLIINFGRQLFHQHKLDADLYAKSVATFGKQGTLDLAAVFADYALTAVILSAEDQRLPPSREDSLPPK